MIGNKEGSALNQSVISCEPVSKYLAGGLNVYVLKSCVNKQPGATHALALSNNTISVNPANYSVLTLKEHEKAITGIKFSAIEPALLFSSSRDGKLYMWDVRCKGQPVSTFFDDSDGVTKPLSCLDYNSNERLLCAGTELIREDAFLLFWDLRYPRNLGGYWNCHTEEITQVNFNSYVSSRMTSSSVDGLINLFDLNKNSEDDALRTTLNIESSVNSFTYNGDIVSCITSIEECHMWSLDKVKRTFSFSREDLSKKFQCKVDYLIDTFIWGSSCYLATGANEGNISLWLLQEQDVEPVCKLINGHSDVVRTLSYSHAENIIISGGEDGFVCYWTPPPRVFRPF